MDTDEALSSLGDWGKWQVLLYLVISIAGTFPAAWHMLAIVFLGGEPKHRCILPNGSSNSNIPYTAEGDPFKCDIYKDISVNNETISCPEGWEYWGELGHTIASQWDLVCDNAYLVSMSQTIMVIGVMVGAMGFTMLSDMYGRKPVFLFSQWAMVVIGTVTAFVDNYYLFAVLRFCAGALQQGIILTGFVMACELFPAKYRTFAGTAIEDFWALGMCLLALFGYCIRDWRYFQVAISLPGILTISFFWILPETVPWLIANNRTKQAEEVLRKAAKLNGKELPDKIFGSPEHDKLVQNGDAPPAEEKKGFFARFRKKNKTEETDDTEKAARYTLLDVLRNRTLGSYAIIMCLLWFVNSLVYYGLSLSTSELAGNVYLNFFLSGLVEIPAYTLCIFVLQKWGRRWPLVIFHIIAGVSLCITMFIPNETDGTSLLPILITLNMIGKFGITGSFAIVFLYAPEIFPTTLRSQAMGISSLGGRLGNMLAPFSSYVAKLVPWLPGILFGVLSIGVGLLALILPETLNRPLPQTIEDIENWKKEAKESKKGKSKDNKLELAEVGNDVRDSGGIEGEASA